VKIERIMRYNIPVPEVYAMSCLPEFQERKCADAGALKWDVAVTVDGDTAVVRTTRTLPTTGFPALIRKIVPRGVTATETFTWGEGEPDGTRIAQFRVDFHGSPGRMAGTITLRPDGDGATEVLLQAEFAAHLPVVGRGVEKLAVPIIFGLIDAEERTGRAWVADAA
jgi:Protein of unknown function (DUF2505)